LLALLRESGLHQEEARPGHALRRPGDRGEHDREERGAASHHDPPDLEPPPVAQAEVERDQNPCEPREG